MSMKCLMNGLEVNSPCTSVCSLFGDCVSAFEAQKKPKVVTNADRYRAMSDEELAKWFMKLMMQHVACFGEGAFGYSPCRNEEHDCVKCGEVWLQQPAEEVPE